MKFKTVVWVLLLTPALAFGQTSNAGLGGNRPRSSYDPGAAGIAKDQQQSGVSAALKKFNPQDKDYGAVIEQGRIAVFEQTIEDFYWRSCMVLTVLLMLSVMYIVWLWSQRDVRLSISGDIVAQLYNSHVAARAKALETIEKHNQLVRRYNVQSEEIAKAKAEAEQNEEKESRKNESKIVSDLQTESRADANSVASQAEIPAPTTRPHSAQRQDSAPSGDDTHTELKSLVKTLQAQITAKDQKIANLRTQINRAHSSLTEEREAKNVRPS